MTELMPGVERKEISYAQYRNTMAMDGDIALFQPRNIWGRLIAVRTGGKFCHVGGLIVVGPRLVLCEYMEKFGGHALPFSHVARRNDGVISIFRVSMDGVQQRKVAAPLFDELGESYGWSAIALIALADCIGLRFFTWTKWYQRLVARQLAKMPSAICSQHIAQCFAYAGIVFEKKRANLITPNDIANSAITTYVGTIVG